MLGLEKLLKDLESKSVVCEANLSECVPTKAYFLGKEHLLNCFKESVRGLRIVDDEDLSRVHDEAYIKGFFKGQELVKNNLKFFLKEV